MHQGPVDEYNGHGVSGRAIAYEMSTTACSLAF
jgi:hypothetical protein